MLPQNTTTPMKHATGLAPNMVQRVKSLTQQPLRIARQRALPIPNANLFNTSQAFKSATCMRNVLKRVLAQMIVVREPCAVLWHQLTSQRNMTRQIKLVMAAQTSGERKDRSVRQKLWMFARCRAVPIPSAASSNSKPTSANVIIMRVANPHVLVRTNVAEQLHD